MHTHYDSYSLLFCNLLVGELDHHVAGVHVDDREGSDRGPCAVGQLAPHKNHHVFQLSQLPRESDDEGRKEEYGKCAYVR